MDDQQADYEKLLNELYEKMPKKKASAGRFEVPVAEVITIGSKTTLKNLDLIASYIRRKPAELGKFVLKELGVPGSVEAGKLAIQGKFSQKSVSDRIDSYVKTRVLCKECRKPDTNITQIERNVYSVQCEACGAKNTVMG